MFRLGKLLMHGSPGERNVVGKVYGWMVTTRGVDGHMSMATLLCLCSAVPSVVCNGFAVLVAWCMICGIGVVGAGHGSNPAATLQHHATGLLLDFPGSVGMDDAYGRHFAASRLHKAERHVRLA
jgi:hypothetical protein